MFGTRTLKHSPTIMEVAEERREFEASRGPTDLIYRGRVYDPYDGTTYEFTRPLIVEKLLPKQGRFVVAFLEGFLSWSVIPVEPYSFDIIDKDSRRGRSLDRSGDEIPLWADGIQPYAAAGKLTSLEAMLRSLGFRNPVDAPTEGSISASFRSASRRCGIYVLHFANGDYYVGQTVDITKRFLQHRKRHSDIVRVSFKPIGRRSLNFHEAHLIRLLQIKRFRLRNIDMTSILATEPGDFDELMDHERQKRWLADPSYIDLGDKRVQVTGSDAIYHERYAELKRMESYDDAFAVVRAYVYKALPAVMNGEASYWQASVLPSGYTVLVRININWQEVFFAQSTEDGLFFYMLLSRHELERMFGETLEMLSMRYPDIELEEVNYRAGGSDQVSITIWDARTALRFINDPDVLPALRHYNLRLMKKGKCPWGRSHNFALITDILGEQPAAQPRQATPAGV